MPDLSASKTYPRLMHAAMVFAFSTFLLTVIFILMLFGNLMAGGEPFLIILLYIVLAPVFSVPGLILSIIAMRKTPKSKGRFSNYNKIRIYLWLSLSPFAVLVCAIVWSLMLALFPVPVERFFDSVCLPKNQSELCGTYSADYGVAREKLTLKKDGSFAQEVTIKATSELHIAEGTWVYDPRYGTISFGENFMVVTTPDGEFNPNYAIPTNSSFGTNVDKCFGYIRMLEYKKTE